MEAGSHRMMVWKQEEKGDVFLRKDIQTPPEFVGGSFTLALESAANELWLFLAQLPEITCWHFLGSFLDLGSGSLLSVLAPPSYGASGNSLAL